jgi:hypothetical protein
MLFEDLANAKSLATSKTWAMNLKIWLVETWELT